MKQKAALSDVRTPLFYWLLQKEKAPPKGDAFPNSIASLVPENDLTFRELEATTSFGATVFFTFNSTRVTGEEPTSFE